MPTKKKKKANKISVQKCAEHIYEQEQAVKKAIKGIKWHTMHGLQSIRDSLEKRMVMTKKLLNKLPRNDKNYKFIHDTYEDIADDEQTLGSNLNGLNEIIYELESDFKL